MTETRADVPRATVRLQLHAGFDFRAAAAIVPYLDRLGASHVYASPINAARPGSEHGYDVTDHTRLNPELGGEEGFAIFSGALRRHSMGLVLDFVPNHMGVGGADNPYWLDVLEWGPRSPYAAWFDIDWQAGEGAAAGKLLVPVLGAPYGEVLEEGGIELRFDPADGTFAAWYFQHRLPISPNTYADILAASGAPAELVEQADALAHRPGRRRHEENREAADALKARLAATAASAPGRRALAEATARFFGTPGDARSFLALHRLLERQHYRPAFWRVATDEINYRRFFDINDLAGLRVEDPTVFRALHPRVLKLIEDGHVTGLRLDHVDGLFDPASYCARLQEKAAKRLDTDPADKPLYLLAEKILAPFERLPPDWQVHGTTGYDFMGLVNALFIDPAAEQAMTRIYARLTGCVEPYEDVVETSKRQILRNSLSSEFTVIARRLARLAKSHWRTRDFTYQAVRNALADVIACFPVYRTYIAGGGPTEADRRYVLWAVRRAIKTPGPADESIYAFICEVLLGTWAPRLAARGRGAQVRAIARRFQQLTGPVTAKSVEDTAFYRYTRFISLNEVGSEPGRWATTPNGFHYAIAERARAWPYGMLATATHDHKRGEDMRARLNVISEVPRAWAVRVRRWMRLNRPRRRLLDGDREAPGSNAEYLYYQTLVGAWPLDLEPQDDGGLAAYADRLAGYMIKAVREAKLRTSWTSPDQEYESAVEDFVRATLDPVRGRAFLAEVHEFVERIAPAGAINGLAQTTLKLTVPGVPDLYQGAEFWDLSLVDPDNRRPVDYQRRQTALEIDDHREAASSWRAGDLKLFVIKRLLELRRRRPALFRDGRYEPVEVAGPLADRCLAFQRRAGDERVLVLVPRLVSAAARGAPDLGLATGAWNGTRLAVEDPPAFRHVFSGDAVHAFDVGRLLEAFPVCVLEDGPGRVVR
jgi:(1->4)-alpha-D-glucan 1-alpha-D-glucosylmutase